MPPLPPDLLPRARFSLARRSLLDFLGMLEIRSDDPAQPAAMRLDLYQYQRDLAAGWAAAKSQIILKARQIGASTLLRGYALWRAWSHGWAIGYYSRGQAEAIAWLDALVGMIQALPAELRPAHLRRSGDLLEIDRGSIRVFPGTQQAGIGYTFQLVIADEAAHHPYGRENYANYAPTLSAGGQYLCLSTADPATGPAGWFWEMWQQANSGGPYCPVFLGWRVRPDRDDTWYAARAAEFAGNVRALRANYPDCPEDAFLGLQGLVYGWDEIEGRPIFDRETVVRPLDSIWAACKWRVVGIDPGGGDPTAIVPVGVSGKEHMHVFGEFYRRGAIDAMQISEYLGALDAKGKITLVMVDRSQASLIATLRRMGWPAHAANTDKQLGISAVRAMLASGRLSISPAASNLINEFGTYWWAERRDMRGSGKGTETRTPALHHADALDALRYAVLGILNGVTARGSGAGKIRMQWGNRSEHVTV